jgi:hypothetical protein
MMKGERMKVRKVIRKRIRRNQGGVQVNADVDGVIAANVGEKGSRSRVRSRSRSRIVQRTGQPPSVQEPEEGGEQDG